MNPDLWALRGFSKRIATQQEIETTKPFYKKGGGKNARTGILFIHGFSVTPANFKEYANLLAEQGYTVSIPLLPGHGQQPEALLSVSWLDWLDAVIHAYDQLHKDCEKIFVTGISLGSALALHLSLKRQDIAKLFLLAPAVYPIMLLKIGRNVIFPILKFFGISYWLHVAGDVKKKSAFELGYAKVALNGMYELYHCMNETQKILPQVKGNVLIFQGKKDHEVPPKKALDIYDLLGTQTKELVWLDNAYHEIPRDFDCDIVYQRILKDILHE